MMSVSSRSPIRSIASTTLPDLGVDVLDVPGAGASGGLGAALIAFLGARLSSGAEVIGEAVRIHAPLTHVPYHERIDQGFVGTPFIFNGYEQNSQWLDPKVPLRQVDADADQSVIQVSSLEGYGAPIIDLGHWFVGSRYAQVVGTMRNFVPERMVRATGRTMRMNIDDGDIFIGEFENGAIGSVQTSFVTVGNYPGLEARVYGSEGALICRLVEEFGVCESLKAAKPDAVEFRELEVPARLYPRGGSARESWRTLFYANLVSSFISEVLSDAPDNEGNFFDGARVQETVNAVERSFRERRWVSLPLEQGVRP